MVGLYGYRFFIFYLVVNGFLVLIFVVGFVSDCLRVVVIGIFVLVVERW